MKKNYFLFSFHKENFRTRSRMCLLGGLFCFLFLFQGLITPIQAKTLPTQKTVSLKVEQVSVKTFLDELQKVADVDIMYSSADLPARAKVTLVVANLTVDEVLRKGLKDTGLDFKVNGDAIIVFKAQKSSLPAKPESSERVQFTLVPEKQNQESSPQEKTSRGEVQVTGTVADEVGEPLPGAAIMLKSDRSKLTATDENGVFKMTVPQSAIERDFLMVSFLGMQEAEVALTKQGNYLVTLAPEALQIENVVVTGYQTLSKERATGSFAVVSQKDIEGKLQQDILSRLQGTVAGMSSYRGKIQIRGASTINGETKPLYVVDGTPFEGDIDFIHPSEIVNVTVLKDATAASIYGARSANGVIVITTKGGAAGATKVSYNGSVMFTPFYDTDYNNLMDSREFVDFQEKLFNINPGTNQKGYYMNEVRAALFAHKDGKISSEEKDRILNMYRGRDREQQARDLFVRTAINHQHNVSVTGGSEKNTYALSLNFNQNLPYEKGQSKDRVGFNFKNDLNFTKWFKASVGVLGSLNTKSYDNGFVGSKYVTGASKASYLLFFDELGNEQPWYMLKDQAEIDRLNSLGLQDESYYPLREKSEKRYEEKQAYLNLNVNLNFKIIEGLTLDLRYQQDFSSFYSKQFNSKDSWNVKNMINDATQIVDGEIIKNIPDGGQIHEGRGDRGAYTLRAQLNYNKKFSEKHNLSVIAGAERRKTKNSRTNTFRVGYDDQSLSFKAIDEKMLGSQIKGTESLLGTFTYSPGTQGFIYKEDRYVSFYGNASYTFNKRTTFTASIRMDQSNLFGTDPKYQYRPLWSVGGQHVILQNKSWVDRLVGRVTYGINGNIPKTGGPYLTVESAGINNWINDYQSKVVYPPNSGLRWEKTGVLNVAVDFNLFKSRLNGSIEFYNKSTIDLLYKKLFDPTYGWNSVMVNYGDMYNRGVEVSLNSQNIVKKNFSWNTTFNFSYNKNEVTRLEQSGTNAVDYIDGVQIREGKPLNGIYSVRWAGLSEKDGSPQAYTKDGKVVNSFANLTAEDLVYSGTTTPPYTASLSNSFRYKDIGLSFMFTYYGGHVMRGVSGDYLINTGYATNQDRLNGNFWEKPGDEQDPSKAPAFKMGASENMKNLWNAADKHIQKGDYLKLEEIILDYSLPQTLLRKTFIKQVRFVFQVQNVWKWAANNQGLDPEAWASSGLKADIGDGSDGLDSPDVGAYRGNKKPTVYTFGLSLNF